MARPKTYRTNYPNLRRDTEKSQPNTVYYGDFVVAGQRYRPVLGRDYETSKLKLQALINQKKREAKVANPGVEGPETLLELQEAHLHHHRARIRPSTAKSYEQHDRIARSTLGAGTRIVEIKRIHIESWIAKRTSEVSLATVNRGLVRLKQIFRWAFDNEWIARNPTKGIKNFREYKKEKRYLSREQEKALLAVAPDWLGDMLTFAILTGLRQHELLKLKWDQIRVDQVYLTGESSKGHHPRRIPLHPLCLSIIERQASKKNRSDYIWPNSRGNPIDRSTFRACHWRPAFDLAGLEHLDWHRATRHTFCTRLQEAGVDVLEIAELAGHRDITTTRGYVHVAPERLRAAILSIETEN